MEFCAYYFFVLATERGKSESEVMWTSFFPNMDPLDNLHDTSWVNLVNENEREGKWDALTREKPIMFHELVSVKTNQPSQDAFCTTGTKLEEKTKKLQN